MVTPLSTSINGSPVFSSKAYVEDKSTGLKSWRKKIALLGLAPITFFAANFFKKLDFFKTDQQSNLAFKEIKIPETIQNSLLEFSQSCDFTLPNAALLVKTAMVGTALAITGVAFAYIIRLKIANVKFDKEITALRKKTATENFSYKEGSEAALKQIIDLNEEILNLRKTVAEHQSQALSFQQELAEARTRGSKLENQLKVAISKGYDALSKLAESQKELEELNRRARSIQADRDYWENSSREWNNAFLQATERIEQLQSRLQLLNQTAVGTEERPIVYEETKISAGEYSNDRVVSTEEEKEEEDKYASVSNSYSYSSSRGDMKADKANNFQDCIWDVTRVPAKETISQQWSRFQKANLVKYSGDLQQPFNLEGTTYISVQLNDMETVEEIESFWKPILESDCNTIICFDYGCSAEWPNKVEKKLGKLTSINKEWGNYRYTHTLNYSPAESSKPEKTIFLIYLSGFLIKGVKFYLEREFNSAIDQVKEKNSKHGPLVVCSKKGEGWSGTYIAIDILRNTIDRQIKERVKVQINVPFLIDTLWKSGCMVQNEKQLEFIYIAIFGWFQERKTKIACKPATKFQLAY